MATYNRQNNAVNKSLSAAGLPAIETPPLLTADQAWMRITKNLKQTIPNITSGNSRFYIPPSTPGTARWFVAISTRVRGGVPGSHPTWSVFTQAHPDGAWRAAYSLTPGEDSPAADPASPAAEVPPASKLSRDPKNLPEEIFNHYTKHLKGRDGFAHSIALDEQLGNGYIAGRQVLGKRGTVLTRKLTGETFPMYTIPTSDEGVLVFSAERVADELTPARHGGRVSLRARSNDAALSGNPAELSASRLTINRLEMFLTYIPSKASNGRAEVLAYSETATSVHKY
ncbi:hypothetical protein ABZ341_34530 [Streptomyces sp. NPDC006173]|uniref:hypothetical protein n=1 Tax=Streptomyces sp. NPDC006173 TaxID=3155349 RepID=UPI00340EE2A3